MTTAAPTGAPPEPAAMPNGTGAAGPRLRPSLAELPAYRPGRAPSSGGGDAPTYKLSSNENPYEPLPGVVDAVTAAARELNRYPDMFASGVVRALADRVGTSADRVVTGTGSVAVLEQVVKATCEPGDEIVMAWRSFEAYPIVAGVAGASTVRVPLDGQGRHDLPAMAAAVTASTRLVLLCSPNNPTGPAIGHDELTRFLAEVPDDLVVALDEAYLEFVRDPAAADALALQARHRNLVVLRTFSKAYGLAALRVGYAVADPAIADALRLTGLPFGVSGPAQAAALASLAAEGELLARVEALVQERSRVVDALAAVGWQVPEPQGNFVWLALGPRTAEFATACESAGVTVRGFGGEGARCSVGEREANDAMVTVAARFAPDGG